MGIQTKKVPEASIMIPKGSTAFQTETAPHLPRLPIMCLANGKRGSGKSTAVTNLLRMYKETGTMDRILIISPTFNSNKKLMADLDIKEEDVFSDPDEPGLIQKIIAIVEQERDDFLRYLHLRNNYKRIMRMIQSGQVPMNPEEYDDYLMSYYDPVSNSFSLPKPKYSRYEQGKPPVLALFIDDSMCSKLMTNRKFPAMIMRHRHLGDFPTGGAVGLSVFIALQTYKANSGVPKCVRNQATSICLFRTKDKSELKGVAESFSGEIETDTFMDLYEMATAESPHDFLFCDLAFKKKEQASMFRRNFDTYLMVDGFG
jgi:hypothetical protein